MITQAHTPVVMIKVFIDFQKLIKFSTVYKIKIFKFFITSSCWLKHLTQNLTFHCIIRWAFFAVFYMKKKPIEQKVSNDFPFFLIFFCWNLLPAPKSHLLVGVTRLGWGRAQMLRVTYVFLDTWQSFRKNELFNCSKQRLRCTIALADAGRKTDSRYPYAS
jgi:hypothetical protein